MTTAKNSKKLYTLNHTDNSQSQQITIKSESLELTSDKSYRQELERAKSRINEHKYAINILELQKYDITNQLEYVTENLNRQQDKNREYINKISSLEVENKYLKYQYQKLVEQQHDRNLKAELVTTTKKDMQSQILKLETQRSTIFSICEQVFKLVQCTNFDQVTNSIDILLETSKELTLKQLHIKAHLDAFIKSIKRAHQQRADYIQRIFDLESMVNQQKENHGIGFSSTITGSLNKSLQFNHKVNNSISNKNNQGEYQCKPIRKQSLLHTASIRNYNASKCVKNQIKKEIQQIDFQIAALQAKIILELKNPSL